MIDLRSDTVTQPTREMRNAMRSAPVGDDVYGEDPSVNELERLAANLLGKEAALMVPSGTMANLIAVLVHVPRGGELIAESEAHIVLNEASGHAAVGGVSARTVNADADGRMPLEQVAAAFRDVGNLQQPATLLVTVENTNAHAMGAALDPQYTQELADLAHARGAKLHVDGARIFNAAAALGCSPKQLVGPADTAMFCLSKGLGCPIGSVLVGSDDFIGEARRVRKLLGGGMRQAGIIASAGLVALQPGRGNTVQRLVLDHERARRLAAGLAQMDRIDSPRPEMVASNIVIFRLEEDALASSRRRNIGQQVFLSALQALGVRMMAYPRGYIRAVLHLGISDADIEVVLDRVRRAVDTAMKAPRSRGQRDKKVVLGGSDTGNADRG